MNRRILAAGAALGLLAATGRAAEKSPDWGFDTSGMDRKIAAGHDFFAFANGVAVSHIVIPPDRTNFGAFVALTDLSEKRVHTILDEASAKAADQPADGIGKAGAMYKAFMDEAGAEKLGASPMKAEQEQITALKTKTDFATLQGRAQTSYQGSLFAMAIEPDAKDPTRYSVTVAQAGLGMPDRDYYTAAQFADKKAKYAGFVTRMLTLAGWADPAASAAKVVAFEQKIAEASWERAEERDPDKVYNPMTPAELTAYAPGFDWAAFLTAAGLGTPDRVVIAEKTAIAKIAAIAGAAPMDTLQAWAAFHLAMNAAPVLSKDFVTTNFEFQNHELQGQPQQRPRWKRAVAATESALGEAIGEVYVDRYYPPEAQAKMEALTHDLRAAFRVRLQHNSWMAPATRDLAVAKLDAFDFQIGKPKKWRDYSTLAIDSHDLYGDVERGAAFEWAFWLRHLGHSVDKDQWDMTPQTVNAYNNPVFNEVVFPAAILQPPFFDAKADDALNYGAIGAVIGHEMTHGYDDQGSQFDAQGNYKNWWSDADKKDFKARTDKLVQQFDDYIAIDNLHVKGALTLGENIADLGGLNVSLDALLTALKKKPQGPIDGFSPEQRFFINFAHVWARNFRPEELKLRLNTDVHAPAQFRAIAAPSNMPAFAQAFQCKAGDAMVRGADTQVKIW